MELSVLIMSILLFCIMYFLSLYYTIPFFATFSPFLLLCIYISLTIFYMIILVITTLAMVPATVATMAPGRVHLVLVIFTLI